MSGLLSQTLANLVSAEAQIKALAGIPAAAQAVQADSLAVITATAAATTQLQTEVAGFARTAGTQLAAAQASLKANAPLASIVAALVAVQQQARALKTHVDGVTDSLAGQATHVYGYANQLAGIEAGLSTQRANLQGQLATTLDEEEAAQKKYYYLLALGPFGLIGLAVAFGLYMKFKSDLNDLQQQESDLSSQISRLDMMTSATRQLGSDFQNLTTRLSSLKNATGFLSSELGEVIADASNNDNRVVIGIALQAAITEVATLATDAS